MGRELPNRPKLNVTRATHPQPCSCADRRAPTTSQPHLSRLASHRREGPTGWSLISRSHSPHTGSWDPDVSRSARITGVWGRMDSSLSNHFTQQWRRFAAKIGGSCCPPRPPRVYMGSPELWPTRSSCLWRLASSNIVLPP
jgi:hypothetical protein